MEPKGSFVKYGLDPQEAQLRRGDPPGGPSWGEDPETEWGTLTRPNGDSFLTEKIRTEAEYFQRNADRMRYPKFRCQHLFVGPSVIEAGCKTVVGSRLKQSGMFWTVRGANAIIAPRCCHLNRFENYWEARRAA